jgi:3-methyladenine DNA glycosylase Tag
VQGLDIYTEALRSSLVDNKRKKPKSTPKPPRFPDLPPISESMIKRLTKQGFKPISSPSLRKTLKYNTLPKLPPISENMKKLLSKQGFKPLSKPTPKPPPKNKKKINEQ